MNQYTITLDVGDYCDVQTVMADDLEHAAELAVEMAQNAFDLDVAVTAHIAQDGDVLHRLYWA